MNILNRCKKPTPKFFRSIRNIGIGLATAGGTLLAAPINLPDWLASAATYIVVAGTVASAVSQVTVETDDAATAANPRQDD